MRLQAQLRGWTVDGVDIVQLREKGLPAGELLQLATLARRLLEDLRSGPGCRAPLLLLNGRPDIALAAGAGGVHLTAAPGELTPLQVHELFAVAGQASCVAGVSCHTLGDVRTARGRGADLILFGPVFEKRVGDRVVVKGTGLASLQQACLAAGPVPVLALGGVTPDLVANCLATGAAGIAGIRLFSEPAVQTGRA